MSESCSASAMSSRRSSSRTLSFDAVLALAASTSSVSFATSCASASRSRVDVASSIRSFVTSWSRSFGAARNSSSCSLQQLALLVEHPHAVDGGAVRDHRAFELGFELLHLAERSEVLLASHLCRVELFGQCGRMRDRVVGPRPLRREVRFELRHEVLEVGDGLGEVTTAALLGHHDLVRELIAFGERIAERGLGDGEPLQLLVGPTPGGLGERLEPLLGVAPRVHRRVGVGLRGRPRLLLVAQPVRELGHQRTVVVERGPQPFDLAQRAVVLLGDRLDLGEHLLAGRALGACSGPARPAVARSPACARCRVAASRPRARACGGCRPRLRGACARPAGPGGPLRRTAGCGRRPPRRPRPGGDHGSTGWHRG